MEGRFVGHKTQRSFSALPLDQLHEQQIKILKGDGGIVGLTECLDKLREFMVLAPEFARLVKEFEVEGTSSETKHHEQYPKFQKTFLKDVQELSSSFRDYGNMFLENSGQLIVLHNSKVMSNDVVHTVRTMYTLGAELYTTFTQERILSQEKAWTVSISLNKLPLMGYSCKPTKQKSKVTVLKQERTQYLQMMLSSQAGRNINEEVFANESSEFPPALTRKGEMFHGNKSDLLDCLLCSIVCPDESPDVDGSVLDGCVSLRLVPPGTSTTFQQYAIKFVSTIEKQLNKVSRVDVVWDTHSDSSVKLVRASRASGIRIKVRPSTKIPTDWQRFLRDGENLKELIQVINTHVTEFNRPDKEIVSTQGESVVSSSNMNTEYISPCNHEEADYRIVLHINDMAIKGFKKLK